MKLCRKCNTFHPLEMFSKNNSKKDGLQTNCKICCNKRQKSHYVGNKIYYKDKAKIFKAKSKAYVRKYKNDNNCSICGDGRWYVLDFHHIDPAIKTNEIGILAGEGYGIGTIKKEINKCILLCSNCHRELHYKQRSGLV